MIFFVEKMREAFAVQKLLTFFNKKYWCISSVKASLIFSTNILYFWDLAIQSIVSIKNSLAGQLVECTLIFC